MPRVDACHTDRRELIILHERKEGSVPSYINDQIHVIGKLVSDLNTLGGKFLTEFLCDDL